MNVKTTAKKMKRYFKGKPQAFKQPEVKGYSAMERVL